MANLIEERLEINMTNDKDNNKVTALHKLDDAILDNVAGGKEARSGYVCRKCLCTQIQQVGAYWVCTNCKDKGPCEAFWTSDVEKTLHETIILTQNGASGGW